MKRAAPHLLVLLAVAGLSCSTPERTDPVLLPNLHRFTDTVWSSGKPEGEEAFREIARLGVKTVISVDGAKPDVEAARRAGLRYVHLPFTYSGVPRQRALEIAKAVRDLPGPVLIHCHHGKQRSPAAAAVARLATVGGTSDEAVALMKTAGTDPHYEGLYASVATFERPATFELDRVACSFPETAPPAPLVEAMTAIEGHLDRLGKVPQEGDFAHEALLLREGLVEIGRHRVDRDAGYAELLRAAIGAAEALEAEARKGRPSADAVKRVKRSCTACHDRFRDQ